MLRTDLITFNVRERGRKHRGHDRNFDTVALAALINSPAVQERVKHGDLAGYFGHWPRIKFGMNVPEGGIVDGKVVSIPASHRTIELSADPDGTIRHRAEFLDTNEGKIAARLYQSKQGGFSSAIDCVRGTDPSVAFDFCGFDYVMEPNFTTNRGHRVVLDGVADEEAAREYEEMLDAAIAEGVHAASALQAMFDSLHAQHLTALESLTRVSQQNDELVERLARVGVLDSMADVRVPPMRGIEMDFDRFRNMPLQPLAELAKEATPQTSETDFVERKYGVRI